MTMSGKALNYRGVMLDVARHFMPTENLKVITEAAARCGINRLHLHLTEDQGWRLEIRRYPSLTRVGAERGYSTFGGVSHWENNNGYYSQQEIRDLVRFCQEKGIEIIPEVDLPGHTSALLAACPEIGCERTVYSRENSRVIRPGYTYHVETGCGIYQNLICAGRDETLEMLRNIFDEIMDLFPFPMIHLGGDEALKLHWRRCPLCQKRMRNLGLRDEDELQRWLMLEIGKYLHDRGREVIVWNDVLSGGMLPDYFIVQQWLGREDLTRRFMEQGGRVIRSDNQMYYLNRPYGSIDVYRIWEHSTVPEYAEGCEDRLLGMECPIWSERVTNYERAEYLLFPRLIAHALKASGGPELQWEAFEKLVEEREAQAEALGIHGASRKLWRMSEEDARKDTAESRKFTETEEFQEILKRERRCLRADRAEWLMQKLGFSHEFMIRVGDSIFEESAADYEKDDGAAILGKQLSEAISNRENGPWKDLPEDVWLDTMKCFSRFVGEHRNSYGWEGFDRGFWTVRQVRASLFRLGELEYEMVESGERKHISLHIPSDAHLEPELLNASVEKARCFFREWFPDWKDADYQCESWLLSPKLREILPDSSRIILFQNAFDLLQVDSEDKGALEWVFQIAGGQAQHVKLEELPEKTLLQFRSPVGKLST